MKRRTKIILAAPVAVALALVLVFFILERRRYDAPYPAIHASTDPAVIERGKYLAYGPAHCADCHGVTDPEGRLSGGFEWKLPLGKLYTPNITPDDETGIGRLKDEEIARSLRHGVGADGRALLPFMPFANMSDEDLTAVISFLRSQKPVRNAVPKHQPNLLGRVVIATLIKPKGPDGTPPVSVPRDTTAAYGKYLVQSVGNCTGCHTERDGIGRPIGPMLAGGGNIDGWITPNLTPDKETGRITDWSEDTFVLRFHVGSGPKGSPMPWKSFGTITDDDARAMYRYLRSLPAVNNPKAPKQSSPPVAMQ
ncbi:MAG: cytochrome c [Polyangiales bacterium]